MSKVSWSQVSARLDHFFFSPFALNETPSIRAEMIEAYLIVSGWTWDEVLDQIAKPEGN